MKRFIVFFSSLILIAIATKAEDKTPYRFIMGGNSYSGARNVTVTWLAERFDIGIGGLSDWPGMFDSIYDTALSWGKDFFCGPYASAQELNLYAKSHPEYTWADRHNDTMYRRVWVYLYAEDFADSIGMDPESLVVHVEDDAVTITQDGDGQRVITNLQSEIYPKRRFTYQYWNNQSGDTMYPNGYTWLANGYNDTTQWAIAYAFIRWLIEDSAKEAAWCYPQTHRWTAVFSDNQYMQGFAPRLYSYYTIDYTSGGSSSYLDWFEVTNIGNDGTANTNYYTGSTMEIDTTVDNWIDSVGNAAGLDTLNIPGGIYVLRLSNVDKFNVSYLSTQIKSTSVLLENPLDYAKGWSNYVNWLAMSDTMGNRNSGGAQQRYMAWMFNGDFLCSSNPADWNYDSSRIYYCHYAFFLNIYHSNIFCGPHKFNDSTRWRDIYEVNTGQPIAGTRDTTRDTTWGGQRCVAIQRLFINGNDTLISVMMSADGAVDYINDSILVTLIGGGGFAQIDAYADTSETPVDQVWMKPYTGWIGHKSEGGESPMQINRSEKMMRMKP